MGTSVAPASLADALCEASAVAIAEAIRARRVTALAVTEAHLRRIERLDGRIGAFLHVDAEGARAAAMRIDQALESGRSVGPLAGVPVGIKDSIVTEGLPTTAGSRILAGWIPPYSATVVERLQRAGAVVLGKLSLDEFAMGSSNETAATGPCRNPWDLSRVPGGSSGGSAAAVAAGLCAIALGSDTGGSIRQPAALTGTVGIKPTYGRVSRHGLIAYASSLDQVGPMARTVEDCALALEVIAGIDPSDATSLPDGVPPYLQRLQAASANASPSPIRIGVPWGLLGEGLDPDVRDRFRAALATLAEIGATVVDLALPNADYAVAAYYLLASAEASSNLARYDGIRYGLRVPAADLGGQYRATRAAGFGDEVKRRILLGTFALRSGYYDAYYRRAQKVRTLVRGDFDAAFGQCDVVALPTSPVPAFKLGERLGDPLAMYLADVYTIACNLAGLPGISVPCGFVPREGRDLPVGLQLIGRPLDEEVLLATASRYEARAGFRDRRPRLEGPHTQGEPSGGAA